MIAQLNNKTTGEIINIISSNSTGTAYSKYECYATLNTPVETKTDATQLDTTYVPSIPLGIDSIVAEWSSNKVETLESGYTQVTIGDKNWAFSHVQKPTGIMIADVRFFIPNNLILKSIQTTTPFTPIYNKMKDIIAYFSVVSNNYTTVYWNYADMNPDDMAVIESYPEIIIDPINDTIIPPKPLV